MTATWAAGSAGAVLAPAEEVHAMTLDPEFRPSGEGPGQAVQAAVRKLHHEPAAVADQVVTVIFPQAGVVAVPVLHVDVLHQAEPFQKLHGAIDARQADAAVDLPGAAMDLGDFEVCRGGGKDLQDHPAGPGQLQPLVVESLFERGEWHGEIIY